MAFGATTHYVSDDFSPGVGREWYEHEVDCTDGSIVVAAPRQLCAIADGEGIEVLGFLTVTAGTANAKVNLGIYTAAAAEVNLDEFTDSTDVAADVFTYAGAVNTRYVNVSGATTYFCLTGETAEDTAGKYRIYYKRFPVQVA